MHDKATLLYEWRQLRLNLQKEYSQKQLQELVNWLMIKSGQSLDLILMT